MVRTNQGGSILGYAIVGVVMVLLLIGGVYFVRHNLTSDGDRGPVAVEDDSDNNTPPAEDTNNSEEDEEFPGSGSFTPVEPNSDDTDTESQPDTTKMEDTPGVGSQEGLPQTGLGDTLATSLVLGVVVGALMAYKRSHGTVTSL